MWMLDCESTFLREDDCKLVVLLGWTWGGCGIGGTCKLLRPGGGGGMFGRIWLLVRLVVEGCVCIFSTDELCWPAFCTPFSLLNP